MADRDTWLDSSGKSQFWKYAPLGAIKRASFVSGKSIRSLTKLCLNSKWYDFEKTALGGAVIVPSDMSAIELISPDGHIDYASLLNGNFGEALLTTIAILQERPVQAWDQFAYWLSGNDLFKELSSQIAVAEDVTVSIVSPDGLFSAQIDGPDFSNITNMASILEAVYNASTAAHDVALSTFQIDTAAFGWIICTEYVADDAGNTKTDNIGFLFRE